MKSLQRAHGANRLASNSLLEAVVFAARIAEDIQSLLPAPRLLTWSSESLTHDAEEAVEDTAAMTQLRDVMSAEFGVVRTGDGMREGLATIMKLAKKNTMQRFENVLNAATLIAVSAILREESRGGHYRTDFPESRTAFAHRRFITLAEAERLAADIVAGRETVLERSA